MILMFDALIRNITRVCSIVVDNFKSRLEVAEMINRMITTILKVNSATLSNVGVHFIDCWLARRIKTLFFDVLIGKGLSNIPYWRPDKTRDTVPNCAWVAWSSKSSWNQATRNRRRWSPIPSSTSAPDPARGADRVMSLLHHLQSHCRITHLVTGFESHVDKGHQRPARTIW